MNALVMRDTDDSGPFGQTLDVPGLADAERWTAVAAGLAELRITAAPGPTVNAGLALHYDFGSGGGFVVARRKLAVELPEVWEVRVSVRGDAPPNGLEFKIVDAAGTSVWRWRLDGFAPPASWTELRIPSHKFEFAWGPAGGGSPSRVGAIEVAVVATPGGRGVLELADLRMLDRGPVRFSSVEASSVLPGTTAASAVDGDLHTCWRSEATEGPHVLTLAFEGARDVGGVVVTWSGAARARAFRIETRDREGAWHCGYEAGDAGAETSFVPLAAPEAGALRVVASAIDPGAGVGILRVELRPFEWSRSPSEFLTNVALASRRGSFPRYLLREQVLWTLVATPSGGPIGLLSEDGAVEMGEGGFTLEPSLFVEGEWAGSGSHDAAGGELHWITWADVARSVRLEAPPLPIATVQWRRGHIELETTPFAEDGHGAPRIVVRYRVRNLSRRVSRVSLFVAVRPFQVTPPWQAFRGLGGPAPVATVTADGGLVRVGATGVIASSRAADAFGATTADAGGLAGYLARGEVPPRPAAADTRERAEAALRFALVLDPGSSQDVFVACVPRAGGEAVSHAIDSEPRVVDGESRLGAALDAWRAAVSIDRWHGPREAVRAFDGFTTAIAHILACRDGAALQPGPRRYTRSWIRDGAVMSAALARAGRADAARDFIRWYAPFQRDDGYVPCCVDRDGIDPLVEHDSHGQFIYAVAETFRFTRDLSLVQALWPGCARAAAFIEELRATRKTDEFRAGARRACFGLLPESVSHEGYLAQPVHSYWDDFWALRGLRDAAFLARALGLVADAQRWSEAAADLAAAIAASMRVVMEGRSLATVPASVEWADFDPTAVAGAISLVGAADLFPAEALWRTFDEYLRGFRARREPEAAWSNYTPYEVRIVGALVRMGRRDDANDLLDFLLADRRPVQWNQWPEIAWRDAAAPGHLGDLPHCWIGAEYAIALRSMLVYERESDDALVIGAGLRRDWLDAGAGIEVRGLPTWYGTLDLSIRREAAGGYRVVVGGGAKPPGGFVAALPDGTSSVVEVR